LPSIATGHRVGGLGLQLRIFFLQTRDQLLLIFLDLDAVIEVGLGLRIDLHDGLALAGADQAHREDRGT